MLSIIAIYVGVGVSLLMLTLAAPGLRRSIDRMADRLGMSISYGRAVWIGGTIVAWPVGLYVLATGHLLMVGTRAHRAASDDAVIVPKNNGPDAYRSSRQHRQRTVDTLPSRRKPSSDAVSPPPL